MTTEKLTEEQAEKIEKVREIIYLGFNWAMTKEDFEYWKDVYSALLRIAENGLKNNEKKVCEKCGGELK